MTKSNLQALLENIGKEAEKIILIDDEESGYKIDTIDTDDNCIFFNILKEDQPAKRSAFYNEMSLKQLFNIQEQLINEFSGLQGQLEIVNDFIVDKVEKGERV